MFKQFLLSFLIFLLFVSPAFADKVLIKQPEQRVNYTIDKDKGILELIGTIDEKSSEGTHNAFAAFKTNHVKIIIVHLHSLGGELNSGTQIIQEIINARNNNIHVITFVDHKEYCASMCTGIFASGEIRMSAPDTLWVFHAPFFADESLRNDPRYTKVWEASVEYLLSVYMLADPNWTKNVLADHIKTPGADLVLTGADIAKQSATFITKVVND